MKFVYLFLSKSLSFYVYNPEFRYINRNHEELKQARDVNNRNPASRPKAAKETMLTRIYQTERAQFLGCGFEAPNLTSAKVVTALRRLDDDSFDFVYQKHIPMSTFRLSEEKFRELEACLNQKPNNHKE